MTEQAFVKKVKEIKITESIINETTSKQTTSKQVPNNQDKEIKIADSIQHPKSIEHIFFTRINETENFICNADYQQANLLNENLNDIVKQEKFNLKQKTIIQFDEIKERVYNEVLQIKKYTGIQVC